MATASSAKKTVSIFGGTDNSTVKTSSTDIKAPQTKPTVAQNIVGKLGQYTGYVNLANMAASSVSGVATTATFSGMAAAISHSGVLAGTRASIASILKIPAVSATLGAITAALSAYSLSTELLDAYKNGVTATKAVGIASSTFGLATGINVLLHSTGSAMLTNPAGWFIAGAVISSTLEFAAIQDIFANGATAGNIAMVTGMFVATTVLINLASFYFAFLAIPFIGEIVAAAVLVFSIIWALLHEPASEVVAAKDMNAALSPVIWTAGPMVLVTAGTVAALMGFKPTAPPIMAHLTVPSYYLTQAVQNNIIPPVPIGSQTPSLIIEPSNGDVVVVSKNDNGTFDLTSYELSQNLQFVSSSTAPQGDYIPFFLYNSDNVASPNPALIKSMTQQNGLLKSALTTALNTQEAMNAIGLASAEDKSGLSLVQS